MLNNEALPLILKGVAAGDRNGGPSRLALLLFDHLSDCGFSQQGVFEVYYRWVMSEGFDTGPTLQSVCFYHLEGYSRAEAVARVDQDCRGKTAGIGPAHRAVPLSLFYRGAQLDRYARQEAQLSHASPIAADVSVAVVRLCAHLLDGVSFEDAISRCTLGLASVNLEHQPEEERSRGGFAPDVLRAAVCFLREASSLTEGLNRALSFAGSQNYCPVLVGSIGSCLFGEVSPDLLQHPLCPPRLGLRGN